MSVLAKINGKWEEVANAGAGGGGKGIQYLICESAAADANKVADCEAADGLAVAVKFVNGNTYGTINTTTHTATGPTFNGKPIKVGNRQIGPAAIVAGDVHVLVFSEADDCWHDATADIVYRNANEIMYRNGSYMTWNGTDLNIVF